MGAHLSELKTDQFLLDALHRAGSRHLTSQEVLEQKVSFVLGQVKSSSSMTREKVRQLILEQEGGER